MLCEQHHSVRAQPSQVRLDSCGTDGGANEYWDGHCKAQLAVSAATDGQLAFSASFNRHRSEGLDNEDTWAEELPDDWAKPVRPLANCVGRRHCFPMSHHVELNYWQPSDPHSVALRTAHRSAHCLPARSRHDARCPSQSLKNRWFCQAERHPGAVRPASASRHNRSCNECQLQMPDSEAQAANFKQSKDLITQ